MSYVLPIWQVVMAIYDSRNGIKIDIPKDLQRWLNDPKVGRVHVKQADVNHI